LLPVHRELGKEVAMKEQTRLYQSAELEIDYGYYLTASSLHFLLEK
jgi:hypothetical protein